MSNHPSTLDTPNPQRPCRLSMQNGLLALAVVLQGVPFMAAAADDVATAPRTTNTTSAPQEAIAWMSGGVGDEALAEMQKAAAAYNVHLMFSNQAGNYLAAVPFTVAQSAPPNAREIYSGVSKGPLLYLKLPPGSYKISAEIDGQWKSQQVQAGAAGSVSKLSFVSHDK